MKKFAVAILILTAIASAASAEAPNQADTGSAAAPAIVVSEPSLTETLPQPYGNICVELSNGKDWILKDLSMAVAEKLQQPEAKILENLGAATDKQYAGNPLLGMSKFCMQLDAWETFDGQLKAAAAFAKGYKSCGVVVIPADCIEAEPNTKLEMTKGKFAWFIPFRSGTNAKITILGKKGVTARVWKLLGDKPVNKEWQGGFWEREIMIQGK